MIIYKYSLRKDLKWCYLTLKKYSWYKSKGLIFFLPNPFRTIQLILKKPKGPEIKIQEKITCFWRSCGTWGSYTPPDKIFICPWKIPDLEKTIRHEIIHLRHHNETKNMTYEEKEKYVNSKT